MNGLRRLRRLATYPLVAFLAVLFGAFVTAWTFRYAQAQTVSPAVVDVQPTTDQVDSVMFDTYQAAPMALLLIMALYGVSRGILWLDSRRKSNILAKLRPFLVMATSILGGVVVSLSMVSEIDLRVILGAMAASIALELRAHPTPKTEETTTTTTATVTTTTETPAPPPAAKVES